MIDNNINVIIKIKGGDSVINTLKMYEELSETMDSKSAKKIVEIMGRMYEELQNTVTKTGFKELKDEFTELKNIVKELSVTIGELAQAQKKTEVRIEELAQAQKKTEIILQEVVKRQEKTEIILKEVVKQQDFTNKHLSGLGFILENEAYVFLPALIKRDFGITLKEDLCRKYLQDKKGSYLEVNITAKGTKDTKDIIIIGESKNQLSENLVDEFIRKKLKRFEGVFKEKIVPLIVTHMTSSPDVKEYALNKGIKVYYSYEFNKQKYQQLQHN